MSELSLFSIELFTRLISLSWSLQELYMCPNIKIGLGSFCSTMIIINYKLKEKWDLLYPSSQNIIHDPKIELNGLTRVDLSCFFCVFYLIYLFFNFIIQHWVGWKLSFIICFDLFFIRIFWSHDQSHKF